MVIRTLLKGGDDNTWLEAGEVVADAYLDMYVSPVGWREAVQAQSDFLDAQDAITGRARVMFESFDQGDEFDLFTSGKL